MYTVIILFTDGESKLQGIEDLEELCGNMQQEGCILSIVMIGDKVEIDSSELRRENAKLFSHMTRLLGGSFRFEE